MNIKTEKDLASAIEKNENTITIEGNLAEKIFRIKATGTAAWVIAFGSIGIAFVVVIATIRSNKTTATVSGISLASAAAGTGAAFSILGTSATTAAISMAVSVRSLSVLKKLRGDYKITKKSEGIVVLSRK